MKKKVCCLIMKLFGFWLTNVNQIFTCLLATKAKGVLDKLSLDNQSSNIISRFSLPINEVSVSESELVGTERES